MQRKYLIGVGVLLVILLLMLSNPLAGLNSSFEKSTLFFIGRIEFWISLLIMYLFSKYYEKGNFLLIDRAKHKWWFYPLAVFGIIILVTIINNIILFFEHKLGFIDNALGKQPLGILEGNNLLIIFTCLTAAVTEEFLFRGYLLSRIRALSKSNGLAILLSALLFSLSHIGYGNFNQVLFPFIIGLIFGGFYLKYKSINTLIACHFIMDVYSLYTM